MSVWKKQWTLRCAYHHVVLGVRYSLYTHRPPLTSGSASGVWILSALINILDFFCTKSLQYSIWSYVHLTNGYKWWNDWIKTNVAVLGAFIRMVWVLPKHVQTPASPAHPHPSKLVNSHYNRRWDLPCTTTDFKNNNLQHNPTSVVFSGLLMKFCVPFPESTWILDLVSSQCQDCCSRNFNIPRTDDLICQE